MFDLTGRVAVVTGASRGLGRQDALTLAGMGADVVITDVLVEDDPNLQQTAESQGSMLAQVAVSQGGVHSTATADAIRKMGRKSLAIKMDVTNREQIREVFKKVREDFGKIDILINNAATLDHAAQIPNQSYELWDRDVKVNLTGAFNCTKEAWPYMVENHWGRLIFMSSVAGTLGGFGQASYSSTKAGLIGLAKTAALERGRHHITANAFNELGADPGVRVAVLASDYEKYFSVGADLTSLADVDRDAPDATDQIALFMRRMNHHFNAIERCPKPVIAAINGHALGGGSELTLCCDFRIMVEDGRSRIGQTESSLGIIPGAGGTQRLPRLIGKARALRYLIESTRLSAQEAQAVGWVDRAVPPAEFQAAVDELAGRVADAAAVALGKD